MVWCMGIESCPKPKNGSHIMIELALSLLGPVGLALLALIRLVT